MSTCACSKYQSLTCHHEEGCGCGCDPRRTGIVRGRGESASVPEGGYRGAGVGCESDAWESESDRGGCSCRPARIHDKTTKHRTRHVDGALENTRHMAAVGRIVDKGLGGGELGRGIFRRIFFGNGENRFDSIQ